MHKTLFGKSSVTYWNVYYCDTIRYGLWNINMYIAHCDLLKCLLPWNWSCKYSIISKNDWSFDYTLQFLTIYILFFTIKIHIAILNVFYLHIELLQSIAIYSNTSYNMALTHIVSPLGIELLYQNWNSSS